MSHTNHRRGHVKKRFFLGQQVCKFNIFDNSYIGPISGKKIAAGASVASECSRKIQHSRSGAKSYISTRFRRAEDQALHHNLRNGEYD